MFQTHKTIDTIKREKKIDDEILRNIILTYKMTAINT